MPELPRPTLALCIPAYNAAEHLPRLLRSAAEQTVPFDEVLVYDDCSTDETASVAEAHGATVIRGDANRGCSTGKNRAAERATSTWLHFHDADDLLLPNFVEVARRWMTRDAPPEVVLLNFEYRDFGTEAVHAIPRYDVSLMRRDPVAFVLRHKVVNFGLYQREAFLASGGFDLDPAVLYNEDAAFHNRLALAGLRFDYEPELTCVNYRYGESMSASNQRKCIRAQYHVVKKMADALGGSYSDLVAAKLWQTAAVAGSYLDWETADAAADLAADLGHRVPSHGGHLFRAAATVAPHAALRLREGAIRHLRPHLRTDT